MLRNIILKQSLEVQLSQKSIDACESTNIERLFTVMSKKYVGRLFILLMVVDHVESFIFISKPIDNE